jgi:hypothetical protein
VVNEKIKQELRLRLVRIEGLKRRTTGEPGVDVVPPLQFVALAQLPAEQHDAAVAERWEIDQPALEVL